jgi:hypothetical protein
MEIRLNLSECSLSKRIRGTVHLSCFDPPKIIPKQKQGLRFTPFNHNHCTFFANGASIDIDTAYSEQLILPGFRLYLFFCYRFTTVDEFTAYSDVVLTTSVCQKSKVSDSTYRWGSTWRRNLLINSSALTVMVFCLSPSA